MCIRDRERVVKERMTIQDIDVTTPQALMNIRPVTAAIKAVSYTHLKGQYLRSVTVTSTMGPGVKVNPALIQF